MGVFVRGARGGREAWPDGRGVGGRGRDGTGRSVAGRTSRSSLACDGVPRASGLTRSFPLRGLGRPGSQRGLGRRRRQGAEERTPGSGQASLLLHRAHHHGHPPVPRQKTHPQRHLRIYNGPLSVLPREISGLAELDQTQPFTQRLLRQDPQGARESR